MSDEAAVLEREPEQRSNATAPAEAPAVIAATATAAAATPRKRTKSKPPRFVQPAYFYPTYDVTRPTTNQEIVHLDPAVELSPEDDPGAARGIPVFKPCLDEFSDFEGYMNKVDCWGRYSGIVKVIPPDEWTRSVPPIEQRTLQDLRIKNPIQQNMMGRAGLFRQNNIEKNKTVPLTIQDWFNKCNHPSFRAPGPKEGDKAVARDSKEALAEQKKWREQKLAAAKAKKEAKAAKVLEIEERATKMDTPVSALSADPAGSEAAGTPPPPEIPGSASKPKGRPHKDKMTVDPTLPIQPFYADFQPRASWLPDATQPEDWTPEACRDIERRYWKGVGIGEPSWYGADLEGSLFRDPATPWNVAHLPNLLNRLSIAKQLPGVNSPYLYFGMWRAAFSWHVEDMDLFSINYIHFGAPKHWYAIPQAKAEAFERTLAGYFPGDAKLCDQFLRHKSFTVSPMRLANDNIKPNVLVQHQNEFVITYPRGYHSGFNMGFNCAESINFALDSWVERGRRAKVCECEEDSVRIDVEALLIESKLVDAFQQERAVKLESTPSKAANQRTASDNGSQRKRKPSKKAMGEDDEAPAAKIRAVAHDADASRKPKAVEAPISRPCLFCPSLSRDGLLQVYQPSQSVLAQSRSFDKERGVYAHEACARAIPEAYMQDFQVGERAVQCVMGADNIPRDRWNLKCSCCKGKILPMTGAKIQCTKGKCSRAFHVSCATLDPEISFRELEVETWEQLPQEPGAPEWAKPKCQLVKTIQVELLCSVHNPAVKDAKKRQAAEMLYREVTSLPVGSRVKIRASGGVLEVALLDVMPLTQKVRVLWDDKREMEIEWSQLDLKPAVERKPLANEYERPKAISFRTKPAEIASDDSKPSEAPPPRPKQAQAPAPRPVDPLAYRQFLPPAGQHAYEPPRQYQPPPSQTYPQSLHVHVHTAPQHQYYPPSQHAAPPVSHYQPPFTQNHAPGPQYAPYHPQQAPYAYQAYSHQASSPQGQYYTHDPRSHHPLPSPHGQWYPSQPAHPQYQHLPQQQAFYPQAQIPAEPRVQQQYSHSVHQPLQHRPQPAPQVQGRQNYASPHAPPPGHHLAGSPAHHAAPAAPTPLPLQPLASNQIDFNKVLITPELHAMLDRNSLMKQALTDIKSAQGSASSHV